MAELNQFLWPKAEYKRDFDFIGHHIKNQAWFLSKMTGDTVDQCMDFCKDAYRPGGIFEFKDPRVLGIYQREEGTRKLEETTVTQMLAEVVETRRIMSPSMAFYIHPKEKRSILGKFIKKNVNRRGVAKKEMMRAKMALDKILEQIKNDEQSSYKISNNSLSGAHVSEFTILYLKSAHSSLTSTCRTSAAYANANNEKFLTGNRHYYDRNIVLENIASIATHTDYQALEAVMQKYGIHYPTAEEAISVVAHSTKFYFPPHIRLTEVEELLTEMSPLERAAFVYTGDGFQLCHYNEALFRGFVEEMIALPQSPHPDYESVYKEMSGDTVAFVSSKMAHLTSGMNIFDSKLDPSVKALVAQAVVEMHSVLAKYSDLIKVLWTTSNIPASVARFTESTRRCGVVSDTDSTIFTVQWWCKWFTGYDRVDQTTNSVRNVMVYLVSQQIIHILAIMSGNIGVDEDQLHQIAMKNEYAFPVFVLTSRGKHYFGWMTEQEGNVFPKPKLELKGVGLKNSLAPAEINEESVDFIKDCMNTVMAGEQIEMIPRLQKIAARERSLIQSIEGGGHQFYTSAQIKDAYGGPLEKSPYRYHLMWEEVFAPKYGPAPVPPYSAIKVNIEADKPSKFKAWLDGIEDQDLKHRLTEYCRREGKTNFGMLLLPKDRIEVCGVPKEIVQVVNVRSMVHEIMSPFYIELESFGFYMNNSGLTRLVSDEY